MSAPALVTVAPSDPEVLYFGPWIQTPHAAVLDCRHSNHPRAACEVVFRGTLVRWLGSRGPDHGLAQVYLDGTHAATIDSYAPTVQRAEVLFERTDLSDDRMHALRIIVQREKHSDATDCFQSVDGFQVESVVDYPRRLRAMAMDELKAIAGGKKKPLSPGAWEPVTLAARAPDDGVQLHPGVLQEMYERNIHYVLDTHMNPCTGVWVEALPCSSDGRLLGAAAHGLRWEEREDLRAIVDEIVETFKQRQDDDGYCLPYDRSYMFAQSHLIPSLGADDTEWHNILTDERRNYDRVNLTRGMVAAGHAGNVDALTVMRRFYDWLNTSGVYPNLLTGAFDGSSHNCNNGHAGGLLMYFSPVGRPDDLIAVERYFVQDFFMEQMRKGEPLALGYYPLNTPHSYVLLAFEAWLDHYRATGAMKYLEAALGAWQVVHRYYEHIGGSIAICEEPAGTYPPQSYLLGKHTGETCGSVFWADINHRLLQLFPDQEIYAAEIEQSIYNVVMAAQDAEGSIRYHNHLHGKKESVKRVNTCCEVMAAPFIARLPQYIYSIDNEGLWINLFAGSQIAWANHGKRLTLTTKTEFPYDGAVEFSIATQSATAMSLRLRIPSWVTEPLTVEINGTPSATGAPGSYVSLARTWQDGDTVTMVLPMAFRLTRYIGLDQHPKRDRYALSYGPLLMALVGASDLDLTPEELPEALSPVENCRLHFAVRGDADCHYQPYWTLGEEEMTCFPTLR